VSLLSVPYALKAADAQTVGGLPASAFVLAAPPSSSATSVASPHATVVPLATGTTPVTTAGGTVNKLAKFDASADITSSQIFDNGTSVGIGNAAPATRLDVSGAATVRGILSQPAIGTATATQGFNSQPHNWIASVFNSSTAAAVAQKFQWQAEPMNNNTATPSGTFNLLYASGTAAPAETGLKINSKGLFTFATGQAFPGTGTITGITTASGSGLAGGGTSGNLSLTLLKTCTANQILKWSGTAWACSTPTTGTVTSVAGGAGLTGGPITSSGTLSVDATKVPFLAAANTFTGNQTVNGNLSATGLVSGAGFNIGSNAFAFGTYATHNAFLGFGGNSTMTGYVNTATGAAALSSVTSGSGNTASGGYALFSNTTGGPNTASGEYALYTNTGGGDNVASGYKALYSNTTGSANTVSGDSALYYNTTGNSNTAMGLNAGNPTNRSFTTASNNTFIGANTSPSNATTLTNATAIGANAVVSTSNSLVLGGTGANSVKVGIAPARPPTCSMSTVLAISASR